MAKVQEYDDGFAYRGSAWLDFPLERAEQGPRGADLHPPSRPDLPARPVRGQPVQGRQGGAAARGRQDPGVRTGQPPMGPRRHDPAAGDAVVRGLQQPVASPGTGSPWCPRRPRRCGSAGCGRRSWELADDGGVCGVPSGPRGPDRLLQRRRASRGWGPTAVVVVSDRAKRGRPGPTVPSQGPVDPCLHHPRPSPERHRPLGPPLRALFQRRVDGDDALLRLARLRFAQAGLAAEVYADTPEQLEWVLGFAPPSRTCRSCTWAGTSTCWTSGAGRWSRRSPTASRAGSPAWSSTTRPRWPPGRATWSPRIEELGLRPDGPTLLLEYAAGLRARLVRRGGRAARRRAPGRRLRRRRPRRHRAGQRSASRTRTRGWTWPPLTRRTRGCQSWPPTSRAAVASALPAVLGAPPVAGPGRQAAPPPPARRASPHPRPVRPLQLPDQGPGAVRHRGRRSLDPLYGPGRPGRARPHRGGGRRGARLPSPSRSIRQKAAARSATPAACSGTGGTAPTPSG